MTPNKLTKNTSNPAHRGETLFSQKQSKKQGDKIQILHFNWKAIPFLMSCYKSPLQEMNTTSLSSER